MYPIDFCAQIDAVNNSAEFGVINTADAGLTRLKVAIIGGGPSGIVSAKSAIECGLEPTIFEKASTIGGIWRKSGGSMWDNMQTNVSRYTCMFSDFDWPESARDFPQQQEVNEYLYSYVSYFKLEPFFRLKTEVIKITKGLDKWHVEWSCEGKKEGCHFDFVLVCSGIFSKAFIPDIEGFATFKGQVAHSKHYKSPRPFQDKTVLVVGNAFSGAEIAASVSTSAKRVINAIHRTLWILPRYLPKSLNLQAMLPLDLLFYSRAKQAATQSLNPVEANKRKFQWFKSLLGEKIKDLDVKASPSSPLFVAISDIYENQVRKEKIKIEKKNICLIEENVVVFQDSDRAEVDAIIFCTGYRTDLSFFDPETLSFLEFKPEDPLQPLLLHKTVFHPALKGLAFIGMYRGPYFGIIELQARWACMAFSSKVALPSIQEMNEGINEERKIRELPERPQFPHGDYVSFAEDLAKQISVLPNFEQIKLEDPILYSRLWEGPLSPASYRLTGFANQPGLAKNIIEKINRRAAESRPYMPSQEGLDLIRRQLDFDKS